MYRHIEFIDNQPMIELITLKPIGILPLLDEVSRSEQSFSEPPKTRLCRNSATFSQELVVPKGSDKGFLNKMHEHHARNRVYQKVMKNPKQFMVKHFAGPVHYDAEGFLEKNRDTLTDDLLEMLYSSNSWFLNALFDKNDSVSGMQKKSSLSKQFQQQLNSLMRTLNQTEPHYIRCIKPNDDKRAKHFVPRNCYEQLTYSGVFEAVSIRKQGFPFRLKHDEFSRRYSVIFKVDQTFEPPVCPFELDPPFFRLRTSPTCCPEHLVPKQFAKKLWLAQGSHRKTSRWEFLWCFIVQTNTNRLS